MKTTLLQKIQFLGYNDLMDILSFHNMTNLVEDYTELVRLANNNPQLLSDIEYGYNYKLAITY